MTAAWIAGLSHMHWWRFFAWNAAGGIAWATLVGLLAYFLGDAAAEALSRYGLFAAGGAILLAGIGFLIARKLEERVIDEDSGYAAAGAGRADSISMRGSQSSHLGRYHVRSPSRVSALGRTIDRMIVGVEEQRDRDPEAHLLEHHELAGGKPAKTMMMIRAAPVMIRAVEEMPVATASRVEPLSS